jgi:hypothetical protein
MHQHPVPSPIRPSTIRKHRGQRGPFGTSTVVTLLTLLGLAAMGGPGGIRPREAVAHAGGGVITLANYGTATVDGVFADGEYGAGCFLPGSQNVGGTTYHLTLCETNDDVNDYYAVLIDDLTPGGSSSAGRGGPDALALYFDNEHDGSLGTVACPAPEDVIAMGSVPGAGLVDFNYCAASGQVTFGPDSSESGSVAFSFSPDVGYVIEMAHPLDSGDPLDYALSLHDTVGFCAVYTDSANAAGEVIFPKNCYGDGEKYGDVVKKGEFDDQLAKLKALVDSCEPCPPEVRRPLEEAIDQAIRQYTRNDEAATAQTLHGFVITVERYRQSGALTETVGRQLTAVATPLITELGAAEARTTHPRDAAHNGKETRDKEKRGKEKHAHHHRRHR